MLTLMISILISVAGIIISKTTQMSDGSTIAIGVGGFLVPLFLIGFIVRKMSTKVNDELQEVVMNGQKRINNKIQQFQMRPGADPKRIQKLVEKDQKEIFRKSLEFADKLKPFKKWNLFMGKQIATMRMQFLYQLNEFEEVDKIFAAGFFSKPILMEPMGIAMKMARQYKNKELGDPEKTFKRRVKWFKGSRATLLYGVMSWIYVKKGELDKAQELLLKGKESTTDQTLQNNWMALANGKPNKFSNAGLGEEWYGLYLEKMPSPKQKRMRPSKGARRMR